MRIMNPAPIIAIVFGIAIVTPAIADSPASPAPWVVTSERGDFLFKMVPAKWREEGDKSVLDREAFGVAYELKEDGELEELWRTSGWYAFEGHLSAGGRYFVRFGPWASDQEKHTDVAIAFYDRGKLTREYQVRELIVNPDLLDDSVSHYTWRPAVQTVPNGFQGETFHLVMIDKTEYKFDYKTGEIHTRGRDENSKSQREIWAEEEAAAKKKGRELFNASPFRELFTQHFEMSGIEAMRGTYSSCSLEGSTWTADLVPLKELKYKSEICMVLPIVDDQRIEASITPEEIHEALESGFDHPYVVKRFESGGATGMRLRTQGDRLHWNTPELSELLEKITGIRPEEDELAHWAYFIIDATEPRFTLIYLNTKTGEIIDEDKTKWPYEPFLLDAAGKRKRASEDRKPEDTGGG